MKVLVISGAIPPVQAGETDHTLRLCRHLAADGQDVHLLTTRAGDLPGDLPVTAHRLATDWSWRDVPAILRLLGRLRPDGVLLLYSNWVYGDHPMVTFLPTFVRWMAPAARFVTQFEIADDSHPHHHGWFDRGIWKALRAAAGRGASYTYGTLLRDSHRVVVLCEHHRLVLERQYPGVSQRVLLLPPPPLLTVVPDPSGSVRLRHRQAHGVGPDDFLFAFYGYVYPNKGVDTLVRAFQIVSTRRAGARLVIAGGGLTAAGRATSYFQAVQDLTRHGEGADRIVWTGELEPESDEASLWLHAADACVLPFDAGVSLHRSSVAAAAVHGRPILTTRGEVLESPPFADHDNVLLCPPSDAASLATAMEQVMSDRALRGRLEHGARTLGAEWFSWRAAVTRTMAALQT